LVYGFSGAPPWRFSHRADRESQTWVGIGSVFERLCRFLHERVVGFLFRERGPGNASELVRERDDRAVTVYARVQAIEPRPEALLFARPSSPHRLGTEDEEAAQVSVPLLADAEGPRLAARGVLARLANFPSSRTECRASAPLKQNPCVARPSSAWSS